MPCARGQNVRPGFRRCQPAGRGGGGRGARSPASRQRGEVAIAMLGALAVAPGGVGARVIWGDHPALGPALQLVPLVSPNSTRSPMVLEKPWAGEAGFGTLGSGRLPLSAPKAKSQALRPCPVTASAPGLPLAPPGPFGPGCAQRPARPAPAAPAGAARCLVIQLNQPERGVSYVASAHRASPGAP